MTSGLKGQKREWDPLEVQIVENCLASAGDPLGSSIRAPVLLTPVPPLQPSDLFLITIYGSCENQSAVRAFSSEFTHLLLLMDDL